MKENNNRGSMIVLTIIGIATLLVAVIGATFAYFSVTVNYKKGPTPAVVETSTMLITFEQENKLEYTGAIPGRPSLYKPDPENPNDPYISMSENANNKLTFTLTSAPTMVLNAKYNVYLVVDNNDKEPEEGQPTPTEDELKSNDFKTDNLVYLITQNSRNVTASATQNKTAGKDGSQYFGTEENNAFMKDEYDGIEGIRDDELVGIIKKELKFGGPNFDENNKDRILIATGDIGSHGTTETWTLEVWLRETGEEQNEDQGKVFKGHIEIVPVNQDPVTYEPSKVTTTTLAP